VAVEEMRERVDRFDWSSTPLGPREGWPVSLRTAVEICLGTRIPVMILWGHEAIQIYNDALVEHVGEKHPGSLGQPFYETYAEIWDVQGPHYRAVLNEGRSTSEQDRQVCFARRGFLEEQYYTFAWSPIRDDAGQVAGAFHPGVETTQHVISARRLTALNELAGDGSALTITAAARKVVSSLEGFRLDVPFALLYLAHRDGRELRLAATSGLCDAAAAPERVSTEQPDSWGLVKAFTDGQAVDGGFAARLGQSMADGPWPEPPLQDVVLPMTGVGQRQHLGVLVAGVSPRRPLDAEYRTWLGVLAQQIGHHLANARGNEQQQAAVRLLQESLLPESLPRIEGATLAARYRPGVVEAQIGGDWYDAVLADDDNLVIVAGDVVGKGVRAAVQMGRLRSKVRAYALQGLSPGDVLDQLNRLVVRLGEVEFATVVCGIYHVPTGRMRIASAGHPPPLVIRTDGTTERIDALAPPIAATEDLDPVETEVSVAPGEVVVFYTDGLVEQRGLSIDQGLRRLADVAARHRDAPSALVEACVQEIPRDGPEDDIAIIALRRDPAP
jgi:hypothetical protein